jgi:hypothetical protein
MVEEVKAWRAADGSIHPTKLAAAKADAMAQLTKMSVFNHASASAVLEHAKTLVEILQPIADEQERELAVKEVG